MSGRLQSTLAWARRRYLEPEYPLLAVELRADSIGVVRLQREGAGLVLKAAALQELPVGTLVPSLAQPNLLAPEVFGAALRVALERAGALGLTRACLVLPDQAGRMALLPADELSGKRRAELDELVRFRLSKTLPFEVREAQIATLPLGRGDAGALLPTAAVARVVLEQYEAALAQAGLQVGLVELAGWVCFAAATRGRPAEDRLVINWDSGHVTLLLARNGRPVLARSLSGQAVAAQADVAREVFNTVLYYRERLGGSGLAGATLRSAALPAADVVELLREPLGFDAEIFDPWASRSASALALPESLGLALAAVLGRAA